MTTMLAEFLSEYERDDEGHDNGDSINKKHGKQIKAKEKVDPSTIAKQFPQFQELGEDLCRYIVAFFAYLQA